MRFLFEFTVTPTDNSWWSSYRNESVKVSANDIHSAIALFAEKLDSEYCMTISASALKRPRKMYVDADDTAKHIGYVFKASTMVDFDRRWVKKYANMWTTISVISNPFEND